MIIDEVFVDRWIDKSLGWQIHIKDNIFDRNIDTNGLKNAENYGKYLAIAYMSFDHYCGVFTLLKERNINSAGALLRPQFDAIQYAVKESELNSGLTEIVGGVRKRIGSFINGITHAKDPMVIQNISDCGKFIGVTVTWFDYARLIYLSSVAATSYLSFFCCLAKDEDFSLWGKEVDKEIVELGNILEQYATAQEVAYNAA